MFAQTSFFGFQERRKTEGTVKLPQKNRGGNYEKKEKKKKEEKRGAERK